MDNKYPLRIQEIDLDQPPTDEIRTCIEVWHKWRGDLKMPKWLGSELLMDLPPQVLPFTLIVDVQSEPLDFIYRYWGSRFSNLHGFDLTGKSSKMVKPKEFADIVFESQRNVTIRKKPILYAGETVFMDKVLISEYVLRVPMSSDDESVDKIMSIAWMNMEEARDWFKQDF